jgi:hypothetical protein
VNGFGRRQPRARKIIALGLLVGVLVPALAGPAVAKPRQVAPVFDGICVPEAPISCADEIAAGVIQLTANLLDKKLSASKTHTPEIVEWVRQMESEQAVTDAKEAAEREADRVFEQQRLTRDRQFPLIGTDSSDAELMRAIQDAGPDFYYQGGHFGSGFLGWAEPMASQRIDMTAGNWTIEFTLDPTVAIEVYPLIAGVPSPAASEDEGTPYWLIKYDAGAIVLDHGLVNIEETLQTLALGVPDDGTHIALRKIGTELETYVDGAYSGVVTIAPGTFPSGRSWSQYLGNIDPDSTRPGWSLSLEGQLRHIAWYDSKALTAEQIAIHATKAASTFLPSPYEFTYPAPDWGTLDDPAPDPFPDSPPETEPVGNDSLWLGAKIGGAISWLGEKIGGGLTFLGKTMRWGFQSIVDKLGWLYNGLIAGLQTMANLIVDSVRSLGTLIASMLQGVINVVTALPQLILDGLSTLFVPTGDFEPLIRSCSTAFPCSWVQAAVDGAVAFKGEIDAGIASCSPPSIGSDLFSITLPGPAGCSGTTGDATADDAAGNIFGYRLLLRNVFALFLWIGFVGKMIGLAPWARDGDSPLDAVAA